MRIHPSAKIYSTESRIPGAGRGVFAARDIKKDELIEEAPVVVLPKKETALLAKSELYNYYFLWGEEKQDIGIGLGFASLYNHSYTPNATYKKLLQEKLLQYVALRDIAKDEEITVNYNYGNPHDHSPLWIKSIKPPA